MLLYDGKKLINDGDPVLRNCLWQLKISHFFDNPEKCFEAVCNLQNAANPWRVLAKFGKYMGLGNRRYCEGLSITNKSLTLNPDPLTNWFAYETRAMIHLGLYREEIRRSRRGLDDKDMLLLAERDLRSCLEVRSFDPWILGAMAEVQLFLGTSPFSSGELGDFPDRLQDRNRVHQAIKLFLDMEQAGRVHPADYKLFGDCYRFLANYSLAADVYEKGINISSSHFHDFGCTRQFIVCLFDLLNQKSGDQQGEQQIVDRICETIRRLKFTSRIGEVVRKISRKFRSEYDHVNRQFITRHGMDIDQFIQQVSDQTNTAVS
ncbi:tetratricopeptide repeat protein 22-like [Glandiceps talaboti]